PHMPDALISRITSRGPGVGSGNSLSSSLRSPRNTTPFMLLLRCALFGEARPDPSAALEPNPPGSAILQPLSGMVTSPSLRTRAASSPWIATPQLVTKFYVEDHAGPAAACRVRCAGVGIAEASLVVTTILGSRTVKVDPRPDLLSTVMSPPIMRASLRVMARPSPVPP